MVSKYKGIKIKGKKYDEHRYMMEQHLGRKLKRNEVVHHKNEDKKDNKISNFEVQLLSKHSSDHMKKFMNSPEGIKRVKKCFAEHWKDLRRYKNGKYWCGGCKKYLPKKYFWSDNCERRRYKIRTYCKKCDYEKSKIRRLKNGKTDKS